MNSAFRIISAIVGVILFLAATYFIIDEQLMYATIFGIMGILFISVSVISVYGVMKNE